MCKSDSQVDGRESLSALLQGDGVVGVSRLRICPAFIGPTICTLVYNTDAVRIEVANRRGIGAAPFRGTITRHLPTLRRFGPLASWERLRAAAFAAPSCSTLTGDGVGYHHALLDWQGGTEATWSNPDRSTHRQQCELVEAYQALIESSGILLEQGSHVRIRTGLLTGFVGRVERHEGRLRGSRGIAWQDCIGRLGGEPNRVRSRDNHRAVCCSRAGARVAVGCVKRSADAPCAATVRRRSA